MRKLPAITLIVASTFAGSALAAAPAPATYLIDAGQMNELGGVYRLSNGKMLRLTVVDNQLYADVKRSSRLHLAPSSDNTFRSKDGAVTIICSPLGDSADIIVRYGTELPAAIAHISQTGLTRLASR